MFGFSWCAIKRTSVFAVSVSFLFSTNSYATDPIVRFDVPALVCVSEIVDTNSNSQNEKIIELVIPISTQIRSQDRDNVEEFRFDIFWNRSAYPLVEYGPRTQTTSDIEGLVSIEKSNEKNGSLGLNLNGSYEVLTGNAKAEISKSNTLTTKYNEVPQHEALVASGSTRRGTGAFFRFHPSRREIMEGGRDLILAFRVPSLWRGGILKIECRANGNRKVFGAWREPFEENRAFVVPVHLQNDEPARQAAVSFVQSEQNLRAIWRSHKRTSKSTSTSAQAQLFSFVSQPAPRQKLPKLWAHVLIQSGNDDYFERYRDLAPRPLDESAAKFVEARQDLLKLSR